MLSLRLRMAMSYFCECLQASLIFRDSTSFIAELRVTMARVLQRMVCIPAGASGGKGVRDMPRAAMSISNMALGSG